MFFGFFTLIAALGSSVLSGKDAFDRPHATRSRELAAFIIAGFLWLSYALTTDLWVIGALSAMAIIVSTIWWVKNINNFSRYSSLAMILVVFLLCAQIVLQTIPVTIVGWAGLAFVIAGIASLGTGYIQRREGLYPVSSNQSFSILFMGIMGSMSALVESGHLIPFITALVIVVLGIIVLLPVVVPAMNSVATSATMSADPAYASSRLVDQDKLRDWAESSVARSNEVKERNRIANEEKKLRKEQKRNAKKNKGNNAPQQSPINRSPDAGSPDNGSGDSGASE